MNFEKTGEFYTAVLAMRAQEGMFRAANRKLGFAVITGRFARFIVEAYGYNLT